MGFLIFAYRKLFLKRKIDDLNFRAMELSQKKMAMTEKMGSVQQAASQGQEALSLWTNNQMSYIQRDFQSQFPSVFGNYGGQAQQPVSMDPRALFAYKQLQEQVAGQAQWIKAGFDAQDQAQLKQLHVIDAALDQEIALIDSQIKQLTPELENVEKAEDKAAKDEAPKFGVGG